MTQFLEQYSFALIIVTLILCYGAWMLRKKIRRQRLYKFNSVPAKQAFQMQTETILGRYTTILARDLPSYLAKRIETSRERDALAAELDAKVQADYKPAFIGCLEAASAAQEPPVGKTFLAMLQASAEPCNYLFHDDPLWRSQEMMSPDTATEFFVGTAQGDGPASFLIMPGLGGRLVFFGENKDSGGQITTPPVASLDVNSLRIDFFFRLSRQVLTEACSPTGARLYGQPGGTTWRFGGTKLEWVEFNKYLEKKADALR